MYRKYTADKIFDGQVFLPPGQVLITTQDGMIEHILPTIEAGDNIQAFEGILCPGFVNAHCHIELSHLKNVIKPGIGLAKFVQQVLQHRSRQASLAEMQLAAGELHENGTVAVGDICNTAVSVPIKTSGPIYWQNFIEVSGFIPAGAAGRLAEMESVKQEFQNNRLKKNSISPHAPYSVSPELFKLINAKTQGQLISIHNQESAAENELYNGKEGAFLNLYESLGINIDSFISTGKSSIQSWLPHFTGDQNIIAVHNTFISAADIDFLKKYFSSKKRSEKGNGVADLFFCICVNANLFIENTLPPLQMIIDSGMPIVMGTDSYASNWELNMMAEINTVQKHFPSIHLEAVLQWATKNGAVALGISEKYGSFEIGKKPGIVQIVNGKARLINQDV